SSALSPPATIAAQTRQAATIPSPDHRARRGPSLAAVLSTNAVSSPGVMVSSAAATVYASSDVPMECMSLPLGRVLRTNMRERDPDITSEDISLFAELHRKNDARIIH